MRLIEADVPARLFEERPKTAPLPAICVLFGGGLLLGLGPLGA